MSQKRIGLRESQGSIGWRHAGPCWPDGRVPAPEPDGYDDMMQKVLETTSGGCLQVENDSAFVVGVKTYWKQTTVGRYFYPGLIASMRMCRG